MKANAYAPFEIFGGSVRYVVPLFQRPYVWGKDKQWQPLWEDVREVAERVLQTPASTFGAPPAPPHFLGAVVLDQQLTASGFIGVRNIIDGQQRLTTLQLLLDAVHRVVAELGSPHDASGLLSLVRNGQALAGSPHEIFKVWPTDRDQAAFTAAMTGGFALSAEQSATPIAGAHRFFRERARAWALDEGPEAAAPRLNALTAALARHLRVVVIDLDPGDNAQVIFESLNYRGEPLLAADLVKNLLFQAASAQGLDVAVLYQQHWREFDDPRWRAEQRQGRRSVPRIDLFLHHWLTMRLLHEVPTDRVFADFRDEVARPAVDVAALLAELAHDAATYGAFDTLDPVSVPGRFYYRVVTALDSAVVSPFLLWLMRQSPDALPTQQRDRALGAVESWLVRRALVRATSKDVNNTILSLLRRVREAPLDVIGDETVTFLTEQDADSRAWPDDQTVVSVLRSQPIYTSLTRPRLRMVLEALEDSLRGRFSEGQPCPRGLTVEHVMPVAWRERWTEHLTDDEDAVATRDVRVHLLGNLTLVTGTLNPAMSNRPWRDEAGALGKRRALLEHAELKLSAHLAAHYEMGWTDGDVEARTAELAARILTIWPGPVGGRAVTPGTEGAPESAQADSSRRGAAAGITELLDRGVVAVGTSLHGHYQGRAHSVIVRSDGWLESADAAFKTPSAAATALSGQPAVNGWRFWRLADGRSLDQLRNGTR